MSTKEQIGIIFQIEKKNLAKTKCIVGKILFFPLKNGIFKVKLYFLEYRMPSLL